MDLENTLKQWTFGMFQTLLVCYLHLWSIGCVIGELFNLRAMFCGENEIDQMAQILQVLGVQSQDQREQQAWSFNSEQVCYLCCCVCAQLIFRMLSISPKLCLVLVSKPFTCFPPFC
jgi:hypothetical protein